MPTAKVLLIAYWFPPTGGIAVQRALSLARYLPGHGCEVHVLTPRNPPAPVLDPALLDRVPPEVRVHRAWTPMLQSRLRKRLWRLISREPKAESPAPGSPHPKGRLSGIVRRLLSPDPEVVWVPFAKRSARRIVEKHGIDTVLVTAPPFSAFLVGNSLKREFPGLRLIADFRDEWLRFFLSTFDFQQSAHIYRRAKAIERATVEASDFVVTVAPSLVDELRERYSDQERQKFLCIPNGYDPAAFHGFRHRSHQGDKVIVTYVGTVYKTTTPACYFDALDRLPESLRSRIVTRFVGRLAEDQKELVESRPNVEVLGYVPQDEAVRLMEETDYLLLIMHDPTGVTGYHSARNGRRLVCGSRRHGFGECLSASYCRW